MLYTSISEATIERVADAEQARATIAAAERALRHEFDLLGSGPFVPEDPSRPIHPDGYQPIDWFLDPVRSLRFPDRIPYKKWNFATMRPGNADIKYPWELARCQHWVTLGQGFRLTGDERFVREIGHELDDFVEANPTGVGINWTCTMDVALRAVSWAIGLALTERSRDLDAAFRKRARAALLDHGHFIRTNLENTYEVTSNHFLSNLVGLWFLGVLFADTASGREWKAFSRVALEREIEVQVLADGADFESSVAYHRFVTELFLACARLGDVNREPLSDRYRSRARQMVAYLAAIVRPDGLMPQVGDADDGRLHVFNGGSSMTPQDPRHLFAAGGRMFGEPAWRALAGTVEPWEAAWWGFDVVPDGHPDPHPPSPPQPGSRLFPDAGLAVMRADRGTYLLITNGRVGTKGFGNHKHNDQLSFEYHHAGVPLIVDPGSYVYTSDADARNLFRSTAYHNTVSVDAVEQNELRPEWLFRLFESASAEHLSFEERSATIEYAGRHHGYERLPDPVEHERAFTLIKRSGALRVVDRLTGKGDHEVRWHFHLAPGVIARRAGLGTLALAAQGRRWCLTVPPDLDVTIGSAWYSPSYGVRVPCQSVDLSIRAGLDDDRQWEFRIEP